MTSKGAGWAGIGGLVALAALGALAGGAGGTVRNPRRRRNPRTMTIEMSPEETESYDAGGEDGEAVFRSLRDIAQARHERTGDTVEVHTAAGDLLFVIA